MLKEKTKTEVSKSEQKAFQLLTIATFILARTPTVLGYANHNELVDKIVKMIYELNRPFSFNRHNEIIESEEWKKIQELLKI